MVGSVGLKARLRTATARWRATPGTFFVLAVDFVSFLIVSVCVQATTEDDLERDCVASSLAAEDEVGWDDQEVDSAVEALVGLASAVADGDSDEDEHVELPADAAAAPAGAGAAAPQAPPALGAGHGDQGGGIGNAGAEGGGPAAPPPPAVPPVDDGADAGPDPWENWFNASEDKTEGRLPKRDKPKHRFKTRNLNKADMPRVMEGSEFAIFRKLWDEDIMNLAVTNTNLRLAKLRAKDPKPVSYHQDVTEQELWLWQGLTMVMGICRLPSVELYWSKEHFGGWVQVLLSQCRRFRFPTQTFPR